MYISRSVLAIVLIVSGVITGITFGWVSHGIVGSPTTVENLARDAGGLPAAIAASNQPQDAFVPPTINLTIAPDPGKSDAHSGKGAGTDAVRTKSAETAEEPSAKAPQITLVVQDSNRPTANPSGDGAQQATRTTASAGEQRTPSNDFTPAVAVRYVPVVTQAPRDNRPAPSTANGQVPEILIAHDGAIVFVGDDGTMNANTGPASAGGAVAIAASDSDISSNDDGDAAIAQPAYAASFVVPLHTPDNDVAGSLPAATTDPAAPTDATEDDGDGSQPAEATDQAVPADATDGDGDVDGAQLAQASDDDAADSQQAETVDQIVASHANESLVTLIPTRVDGVKSVAVSGLEDHSVSVIGNRQIVVYDDTNVFINRDGLVNANTGDTDSSGLNVVDAVNSIVRSGNSGDGEGNDDLEEDEDEDEDEDEETQGPEGVEVALEAPQVSNSNGQPCTSCQFLLDADDDEDGAEVVEDSDVVIPVNLKNQGYATVTDEGASAAIGDEAFVIGADGFDDVSIRSFGDDNIVAYDDSNVVLGGQGKVNAQIGDSDTGGAVVMGVANSDVRAGCEGDLCYHGPNTP